MKGVKIAAPLLGLRLIDLCASMVESNTPILTMSRPVYDDQLTGLLMVMRGTEKYNALRPTFLDVIGNRRQNHPGSFVCTAESTVHFIFEQMESKGVQWLRMALVCSAGELFNVAVFVGDQLCRDLVAPLQARGIGIAVEDFDPKTVRQMRENQEKERT